MGPIVITTGALTTSILQITIISFRGTATGPKSVLKRQGKRKRQKIATSTSEIQFLIRRTGLARVTGGSAIGIGNGRAHLHLELTYESC